MANHSTDSPQDCNRRTLDAYNRNARLYVEKTSGEVTGWVQSFIDATVSRLPADARILEIGSGPGTHAAYIEAQGFTVERTEASEGLAELLRSKGFSVRGLNLLVDELPQEYDLILANAVIHHFQPKELNPVLQKLNTGLRTGGRLAVSTKEGHGEMWDAEKLELPRYFRLLSEPELREELITAGFSAVETKAGIPGSGEHRWLTAIAHK